MENYRVEAQAIKNAINDARSILLVAHKKPDSDTLGAVSAWTYYLDSQGKHHEAFCADEAPDYLKHLYGLHRLTNDPEIFKQNFDLILVNDSGDLTYAGIDTLLPSQPIRMINVDHHATNPNFGDINLVIRDASSTTEVLARLFMHWDIPIEKPLAEALLYGIVTDTNRLTNPATTYHALAIVSALIEAGADLYGTIQRTLYNKSINDFKLWGLVMSRLSFNERYQSVATYATKDDLDSFGMSYESLEGISNYLSLIPTASMILFIYDDTKGAIKGSLRTVKESVNVGKLALYFGGGGHRKASGFKLSGKLVTNGDAWHVA